MSSPVSRGRVGSARASRGPARPAVGASASTSSYEEQRRLYEQIANGPCAAESAFPLVDDSGALTGPFDAMLLTPALGDALQALGSALRFSGRLAERAREIAIMLVAYHADSAFEIYAHEAVGRRSGLTDHDLEQLAAHEVPASADAVEAAVCQVARRLLTHQDLDDQTYETVRELLGDEGIFELCTLVGYYSMLAVQLKVFS
jgi:4-carboxymuconolactone decarboxylase